jgi:hypothetical protein
MYFGFSNQQVSKLRVSMKSAPDKALCTHGRNLMKKLTAIFSIVVLISFAGTVVAEVVLKEVPLRMEMVAELDGDEVFSNLCAACHGATGKGDGPAVSALVKAVPDLTVLAANNGGVYPYKQVKNAIFGRFRDESNGKSVMPYWGEHFLYLGTGVSGIPRNAFAWERTHTLATYIESLQVE